MRIASNKISDIASFFREELSALYEREEIDRFAEFCFGDFSAITKVDLLLEPGRTVSESELLKYNFAVKDLKKGRPIQYILGNAHFLGMKFKVNEDVLIPRPETEELVMMVVEKCKNFPGTISLIDIGTGSGCIAVSLKKKLEHCHVYAIDVSPAALEVAKENAEMLDAEIHFSQVNILDEPSRDKLPPVSVIVSNPPYVKYSEKEKMERNVTEYEPHQALFVNDEDALVFYRAIAEFGKKKLKPNGKIFVEINENLGIETALLFQRSGYAHVELKKDLQGKERFIIASLD
ncbi:MAG TPA: peptide chain release factor N(5)-glutamine methyltransferase [Bacteroidia bacterium]|nr:peptide chain release factor N(5)-glutamine methyltransferase [Bacteroidia bacterium]